MKLYARLFSKILSSSLMEEAVETRFLFITMILLANADGAIDVPLSALARSANMSEEATRAALDRLMTPDPNSGCRDEEGRRVVPLDPGRERGWRIPSWAEHQKVFTEAHALDLGRLRAAKSRAKRKSENHDAVTLRHAPSRAYTSTYSPVPSPSPSSSPSSSGLPAPGERGAPGSKTRLGAALDYAKEGLPVLPVRDRGKAPLNRKGVHGATTSASKIKVWWKRWPNANIGLATGAGLFVLDIDGGEGEVALQGLEAKHGPLPETLEVRTGRGRHLYFKGDQRLRNTGGKLGLKLDSRGVGGFVVAPPSVHESGDVYAFTNQGTPMSIVPEWLVELVLKRPEKVAPSKPPTTARAGGFTRGYADAALDSACEMVKAASIGERNSTLYHQADGIGQLVAGGGLTREKAAGRLHDAAVGNGIPPEEARATVESGFKAGAKNPRKCPTIGE